MARFSITPLFSLLSLFSLSFPALGDIAEPLSNITTFQVPEADTRILAIYNSSLFQGISGIDIQEISFYSEGGISGINGESSIQIYLGTTPATSLSPTYSDNVIDGETLVYAGTLQPTASEAVAGFTITLSLLAPYFYQPSDGNLLLDIQNTGAAATFPYPVAVSDGSVAVEGTDPTGSVVEVAPLIELSTPEPKPFVLLLTVLFAVLVLMRRKLRRSSKPLPAHGLATDRLRFYRCFKSEIASRA
ncbi:MAG TPA: hypothetical protein VIY49_35410 [Bryobacteraceae bacterium]